MKPKLIILSLIVLLAVALSITLLLWRDNTSTETPLNASADTQDASSEKINDTESQDASPVIRHAATGWSVADDAREAVREAMEMARKRLGDEKVVFAIVAIKEGYSVETVMDELNNLLDPGAKVYGITSGRAVMTEDGYHVGPVGAIGILLVGEKAGIRFGVGSVDGIEPKGLEDQGAEAIRQAIADAGMPADSKPDFILYGGNILGGGEMKIMDGIARVVGKDVLIVGGDAQDETFAGKWNQFTRDKIYSKGLVLTALFTDRKIGWAFESGFRLTETGGVVTKANAEGTVLYEIDHRPALDVYDEWLGGKIIPILKGKSQGELTGYTGLNPLGRRLMGEEGQVGYIVAHALPSQSNLEDGALPVYSEIFEGCEIRLFAGQWQNLINRAEQVTSKALHRAELTPKNTAFGVMYYCWGASNNIPPSEIPSIPLLVRNQIPGVPFIGVFSSSEQGPLLGIRNVSCNLVVSMVLLEKNASPAKP